MSQTEIRQQEAANGAECRGLFLEALRSAPAAFAADYDEESARSSEQIAERFRWEVIFEGFVSGRLHGIVTFLQQIPPKRRHVGMIWNMYVSDEQGGTGLADIPERFAGDSGWSIESCCHQKPLVVQHVQWGFRGKWVPLVFSNRALLIPYGILMRN
jgi:hypothetical protein